MQTCRHLIRTLVVHQNLTLLSVDSEFYSSESIIAYPPLGLSDHSVIAISPRHPDRKSERKSSLNALWGPSRKGLFAWAVFKRNDWSFLDSSESVEVKNQFFADVLSVAYLILCLKNAVCSTPTIISGLMRI